MAHIPLTTQEAARGALAAIGERFMPLAEVIDMATALLMADRDDPAVRAYEEAREFEVRLAHERDEEARDRLEESDREWTESGGWSL